LVADSQEQEVATLVEDVASGVGSVVHRSSHLINCLLTYSEQYGQPTGYYQILHFSHTRLALWPLKTQEQLKYEILMETILVSYSNDWNVG